METTGSTCILSKPRRDGLQAFVNHLSILGFPVAPCGAPDLMAGKVFHIVAVWRSRPSFSRNCNFVSLADEVCILTASRRRTARRTLTQTLTRTVETTSGV